MLHDLLPVPFKESEVGRIADRIKRAQDVARIPMAIENVSFYLHPGKREMGEAEFLARVCDAADCGLMLDVNNAYVNATNFGHDIDDWMKTAPLERVVQMHVAGHDWFAEGSWKIDPDASTPRLIVGKNVAPSAPGNASSAGRNPCSRPPRGQRGALGRAICPHPCRGCSDG